MSTTREEHARRKVSKKSTESPSKAGAVRRGRPPKGHSAPKFDSRIQVKLTPAGRERLDAIVERVDMDGFAEVVRDALRLYDIITEEVFLQGNDILVRNNSTKELERLVFWAEQRSVARDEALAS